MQNFADLQTELLYYAIYFGGGVVMLLVFSIIYMAITPYNEIALIRKGSGAAALSFGGTIIGFSLTLAASAIYNTGFIAFLVWSAVAMIVQIIGYFIMVSIIGDVPEHIKRNNLAVGGLIGISGLVLGIINAGILS
ncbi:DUF350 domain-containing protein [Psychrobacter sp. FDAARGOS_221]|uniref:DUF350 domain-containing protein n=1 Tax=Psychrobacter sp. FDAARGOS_221 TaxID=1975705 RepID=UPI000BB58BA3|nr:DUF350 domain-containing protein [Psychrobacter sp. FDAARGOS_221]PNK59780.1 DUF350 domain-containing protein [Psychrobacter sp. FDAARGOS_221]